MNQKRILLCFENFEATRQDLQNWLLRLREYKPSRNIRIAIAGRDQPGANWDILRKVTLVINLDVFTHFEAEAFLDAYAIKDIERRREILECSGRLPVLMSWLSVSEGLENGTSVPTFDIVERFLRWISDPSMREIALLAAIPRSFNIDVLEVLLGESSKNIDLQSAFDWLLTMPFVQQRSDGWQYHSVVRRMMLKYQRQRSPSTYQRLHNVLADYYKVGSLT